MRKSRTTIKNASGVFMTPLELAEYLGCTRRTIYKKISSREVPGAKIFGRWRFKKSVIDAWLEQQEKKAIVKKRTRVIA